MCRKGIRYQHVEKKNLLGTSSSLPCIGSLNGVAKPSAESYSPPSREEMAHHAVTGDARRSGQGDHHHHANLKGYRA